MHNAAPMQNKNIASPPSHIEVRHSRVHGYGVFAACDLPSGTLVGEYGGRRYTAREARAMTWDDGLTYLFGLSDGTLIDGAQDGNATRHLNHGCEPNCEAIEEYADDGQLTVRIEMIKAVRAGEELLLDYALDVGEEGDPADYPCRCGLARCRGTLVAPVEP
jgi:SET domain-containing protein